MNALKSIHDNTDMRTSLLNFTHLPQYWMGFDLFNLDKVRIVAFTDTCITQYTQIYILEQL